MTEKDKSALSAAVESAMNSGASLAEIQKFIEEQFKDRQQLRNAFNDYQQGYIASGTHGSCSWHINPEGELRVYPTDGKHGTLACLEDLSWKSPWLEQCGKIKSVVVEPGVATGESANRVFAFLRHCEKMDVSNLDTSNTKDMTDMFAWNLKLESLDLSKLDLSSVTTMENLCSGDKALVTAKVNLPNNLVNTSNMFQFCDKLTNRRELETQIARNSLRSPKAWEPPKTQERNKAVEFGLGR